LEWLLLEVNQLQSLDPDLHLSAKVSWCEMSGNPFRCSSVMPPFFSQRCHGRCSSRVN